MIVGICSDVVGDGMNKHSSQSHLVNCSWWLVSAAELRYISLYRQYRSAWWWWWTCAQVLSILHDLSNIWYSLFAIIGHISNHHTLRERREKSSRWMRSSISSEKQSPSIVLAVYNIKDMSVWIRSRVTEFQSIQSRADKNAEPRFINLRLCSELCCWLLLLLLWGWWEVQGKQNRRRGLYRARGFMTDPVTIISSRGSRCMPSADPLIMQKWVQHTPHPVVPVSSGLVLW